MTHHMNAVSLAEHQRVLSMASEFADRAEQAEAAIARVRELCDRIWDDARYAHKYGFLEVVREVRSSTSSRAPSAGGGA